MQQLCPLLIFFLNSALHVSGDKFAHPQEQFLTEYTAFGTMHRHCCRLVQCTKSCIYSQKFSCGWANATVEMERQFHLIRGTGQQQCRCIVPKAVYTVKKSASEDG